MPPIPNHFLDSVVFLFQSSEAAEARMNSGGSGFIASVARDHYLGSPLYIVTNRHVAERARAVRIQEPGGRDFDVIATPEERWHHHPDGDDVSVFPLGISPYRDFYYSSIDASTFMHTVEPERSWLGPGEDVFLLGRYIGRDGTQLDTPMARFGHIAAPPVKVRNPMRGLDQVSYLVEVLSKSGYSGSPVVAFRLQLEAPFAGGIRLSIGEPSDRPLKGQQGSPGTPRLLGINWGHLDEVAKVFVPGDETFGATESQSPDRAYVRQNTGLAAVVPAWKISDILWSEELEQARQAEWEVRKKEDLGLDGSS